MEIFGAILIIIIGLVLISGYIRLMQIRDEYFGDFGIVAMILITSLVIVFIVNLNQDTQTISSKEEVCPEVKEEIVINNGDTTKTTTYIYTFTKE